MLNSRSLNQFKKSKFFRDPCCINQYFPKQTLDLPKKTWVDLSLKTCNRMKLKVAPRVENTEVFKKGWNFANRTYFASCIMKKHYFLFWTKETAFFPYFCHEIIFYSAELFDCAINFKFCLNIIIFLNINTTQTSKD